MLDMISVFLNLTYPLILFEILANPFPVPVFVSVDIDMYIRRAYAKFEIIE